MDERNYTLSEVLRIVAGHVLNDMSIPEDEALKMVQFYPPFESFVGGNLKNGMRVHYKGKLYEVRKPITGITGKVLPPDKPDSYRLIQNKE